MIELLVLAGALVFLFMARNPRSVPASAGTDSKSEPIKPEPPAPEPVPAPIEGEGKPSPPFQDLIVSTARRYSLDPKILLALVAVENGRRDPAVVRKNDHEPDDVGLFQINLATGSRLGYTRSMLLDPTLSTEAAARLVVALKKELHPDTSLQSLFSAYNAGSPTVKSKGIINPAYVRKAMLAYSTAVV